MGSIDGIFNLAGTIVTLAMITVVVSSPNTANVVKAVGDTFANSLKAATATAR